MAAPIGVPKEATQEIAAMSALPQHRPREVDACADLPGLPAEGLEATTKQWTLGPTVTGQAVDGGQAEVQSLRQRFSLACKQFKLRHSAYFMHGSFACTSEGGAVQQQLTVRDPHTANTDNHHLSLTCLAVGIQDPARCLLTCQTASSV